MAPRLTALAVLSLLLLGTATFTYAAQQRIAATKPVTPTKPAAPPLLVVPNVSGQAYVFAKGTLQDAGFAWRVEGAVRGYAANTVVEQRPAAGLRVVDTGAPLVALRLAANKRYPQDGQPEDSSPYAGTEIRYPNASTKPAPKPKPKPKPAPKPAAKPKPKLAARPPAFHVPGARKEPLDEIALPKRAARLELWLARHPHPTNANVRYWLYQNAWIVTGARFGWWHGAQALRLLVRADTKAEHVWGIGARSRAVAQQALRDVEAKAK
jgi:hypothetical protein